MIGFYFFKLAQSIWLGCWNKEGIQNLSVVCKIRSCLIVSPSRQDRSISSYGDIPLLSHNWRKKVLFSSVYHHKPFINQAWQVKMARYWPRSFFFFFFFLLTTTGSVLWKRKKSSLTNIKVIVILFACTITHIL